MFKALSLRQRITFLLSSLLIGSLGSIIVAQIVFAKLTLAEEHNLANRVAEQMIRSLAVTLEASSEADRVLADFVKASRENNTGFVGFIRKGENKPTAYYSTPFPLSGVPDWFVKMIGGNREPHLFKISVPDKISGDLIYYSDLTEDVREKWLTFAALLIVSFTLTALIILIVLQSLKTLLNPLSAIRSGLTRLQNGHYGIEIECAGPPELLQSCQEINRLSQTLLNLDRGNRALLLETLGVQDRERQEIARELHDELGPLLFAIRAHTTSITNRILRSDVELAAARDLVETVELLQQTNRRLLQRLRMSDVQELGLIASLEAIITGPAPRAANMAIVTDIDPALAKIDNVIAQTIYRIVQEGVTNSLRHSRAETLNVSAKLQMRDEANLAERWVVVDIVDDGVGIDPTAAYGRGLLGMRERVRALRGTMTVTGRPNGTHLHCAVPSVVQPVP